MNVQIEDSWREALHDEFVKDYFLALTSDVREAYLENGPVYPPPKLIFNAFAHCSFDEVKVVILGQDPYHGPGQAHGLSFSVPDGVRVPPSLQNIYKEIESDIGTPPPPSGNLERWAEQGVLLLNSTLTVQAGNAGSHQAFGWEQFTDAVIKTVAEQKEHVVFMLWGAFAGSKAAYVDETKHLVLKAPHPSPLSAHRGFFGCRHFSQCNAYLTEHGQTPITW
ncbi:uracil-DNA glycosylase [bacterium]|nr:uracil-DNA glycosylase [bacterium]|tara:strand:+ start:358 stop:1023 length:666 start_codon:yes stop_codon:yes gene_type:complete